MRILIAVLFLFASIYSAFSEELYRSFVVTEYSTNLLNGFTALSTNEMYITSDFTGEALYDAIPKTNDTAFYQFKDLAFTNLVEASKDPWICDFDFVSDYGKQLTLVASDIAVGCAHYCNQVGDTVSFGGFEAKIIEVIKPPGARFYYYDYSFHRLDRHLPVKPCTLAPANIYEYLEYEGDIRYSEIRVYFVTQFGDVKSGVLISNGNVSMPKGTLVTGDSGTGGFLMVHGNPLLIGVAISVAPTYSTFYRILTDEMEVTRGFR